MKRQNNVIAWLILLILLNIASSGVIYWQHSRKLETLSAYTLALRIDKYLLECRRQEKNFFIRNSMEAIQLFTVNHDSVKALLSRLMNMELPAEAMNGGISLNGLLDDYSRSFRAICISTRDHPNGEGRISIMHRCTETARKCHLQAVAIVAAMDQHFRAVHKTTGMVTVILMIAAPILSIMIAVLIFREVVLVRLSLPSR
ncbi:hypothetical protein ACFL5M_00950 [Candidatus Neomarinimicrobiota bacterium]